MGINVSNRPSPTTVQEQAPPPALAEQAQPGQVSEGATGLQPGQTLTGVTSVAPLDGLDAQLVGQLASTQIARAEPTAPGELAAVLATLDNLLANVGTKPADVQMAAAFEAALPHLERATSSAELSGSVVAAIALSLGDSRNVLTEHLPNVLTGNDKALAEQLLQSLPPGSAQAIAAIAANVAPQVVAQLPSTLLRILKEQKPLTGEDKKQLRRWSSDTAALSRGALTVVKYPPVARVPARDGEQQPPEQKVSEPSVPEAIAAAMADYPVTIPGPGLVKLEQTFARGLSGSVLENADVDALSFLVMMECQKDATSDLRDMIEQVKANNAKKAQVRDHTDALKKQQASMTQALRRDYDARVATSDPTLHIDPALVSFDAYCQSQKLQVRSGDLGATDLDGMPGALANLGVSPNQTWYPPKAETVFDAKGNAIPSALVLQAERLQCKPTELSELKRVFDNDVTLRNKFGTFEAMLVAAKADGGLGLEVPPTASQSTAINGFIGEWQAAHPGVEIPPPPPPTLNTLEQIGKDFDLSPEALAAAKAVYAKINPGGSDTNLRSWLERSSPEGAGLSTGLASNRSTLSTFLATLATAPTPPGAQAFAGLSDFSNLPQVAWDPNNNWKDSSIAWKERETAIIAEARTVFGSENGQKLNALNDALGQYMHALMCDAWANKDWTFSPEAKKQAKDNLDAARAAINQATGALAPKDKDAQNYVSVMLGLGNFVMQHSLCADQPPIKEFPFIFFFKASVMGKAMAGNENGKFCIDVPDNNKGGTYRKTLLGGWHTMVSDTMNQTIPTDYPWRQPDPAIKADYDKAVAISTAAGAYTGVTFPPRPADAPKPGVVQAGSTQLSAEAQARLSALTKPSDPPPQAPVNRSINEVSLEDLKNNIDMWSGKKDGLGDVAAELSLKLQLYQERRSKFLETLSALMKKSADTSAAIRQNIK